jgi:hypothetical protein
MLGGRPMSKFCEAREQDPVETVESCDHPDEPYQLRMTCHKRLHATTAAERLRSANQGRRRSTDDT